MTTMISNEQIERVRAMRNNGFAQSLIRQLDTRGTLSSKQAYWFDKLANEDDRPQIEAQALEASKIYSLFESTAARLKYPKVRVVVNGNPLVLSRAGSNAKFPGSINVTDGGPFGNNIWYGRISGDEWKPSGKREQWVSDWLQAFASNPAQVAADYGKMTGYCCFCNQQLTDDRSVGVGYGPICAKHWGLLWG